MLRMLAYQQQDADLRELISTREKQCRQKLAAERFVQRTSHPSVGQSTKFRAYEQIGVHEYWIIDPEPKSVEVFVSSGTSHPGQTMNLMNGFAEDCALRGAAFFP